MSQAVGLAEQRIVTIRVAANPTSRRELQQALMSWSAAARQEGARAAHVYEDVLTPGVFGAVAEMHDAADLDVHLRSPDFGALLGAITVLARDVEVAVCQPMGTFGADALSYIRRMRLQSGGADIVDPGTTRRDR